MWVTPFEQEVVVFHKGRAELKASEPRYKNLFCRRIEGRGVHAFINKRKSTPRDFLYIFEAEIPPFTTYWIGEDGDIAASRLIIYWKIVC